MKSADCVCIDPGQLRHKMALMGPTKDRDTVGHEAGTPGLVDYVWASIEPAKPEDLWQADQVQTRVSHKVTIRWRAGVTGEHWFEFRGRKFNIVGQPLNPQELNVYLAGMSGFGIRVELTGVEDLNRRLEQMKRGIRNKIVRAALKKAGQPIKEAVKGGLNDRGGIETGLLKKSITVKDRTYSTSGVVILIIGPRADMRQTVDVSPYPVFRQVGGQTGVNRRGRFIPGVFGRTVRITNPNPARLHNWPTMTTWDCTSDPAIGYVTTAGAYSLNNAFAVYVTGPTAPFHVTWNDTFRAPK